MQGSVLTADEKQKIFCSLQDQLQDDWLIPDWLEQHELVLLVMPSMSVNIEEARKIVGFTLYEERLLFTLLYLRHPQVKVIYVTSEPIHPSTIEYYLQLIDQVPIEEVRKRLFLFSAYDSSDLPLTQKVLERPRLLQRIKRLMEGKTALITCFNSSALERELSVALGVPLFALNPDLRFWGTKAGSRQIFAECGIPIAAGSDLVWNEQDLAVAIDQLWQQHPDLRRVIIKLNDGFSGLGNAVLPLNFLHAEPGKADEAIRVQHILEALNALHFPSTGDTWETFKAQIHRMGAIVEVFIEGKTKRSPSIQASILPSGEVHILSTHEQILGGTDGLTFLGCQFPADAAYRLQMQDWVERVGKQLATKGALENFSLDCLAVSQLPEAETTEWQLYGVELNLRKGGTTHPFMLLQLLVGGHYDRSDGLFYDRQGQPKYYLALDNLKSPDYAGLLPDDLTEIVNRYQLNFDPVTQTGAVFHMPGTLSKFGKLGVTCIGNSHEQAEQIYRQVVEALETETQKDEHYVPQQYVV